MNQAEHFLETGRALQRQGRHAEAAAAFDKAIAASPNAVEPRKALGNLLLALGRPRRAMAIFEEAVGVDPELRTLCRNVDQLPTEEARCTAVLTNCQHILTRYPNYAEAHYRKATALLSLGRVAEARRASEQALVLNPTIPTYYHVLIHSGQPRHNVNAVSALEQLARCENELDDQDRATLRFLLAKAYEDQGRHADAFTQLQKANTVKRRMIAYDEAAEIGKLQAVTEAFTPQRIAALRASGFDSTLPVFVIGMPRSGTTLIEQILASHKDVFGAGELTIFADMVKTVDSIFPGRADTITPGELYTLGKSYVDKLATQAPQAERIVDKQPFNFLYAGLIHSALPGARIIHVKRDALDTCFSCYAQSFAGDLGFAYDQAELGRYYKAYERLMTHWRAVLPPQAMLEIQYEELVGDLQGQVRRLTDYCGLEWDPRCLAFHEAQRAVVTASVTQVRQPIYRKSIGRAQTYAAQLAPLYKALGLS